MRIPLYHVDAFTSEIFSGNPAAVCLMVLLENEDAVREVKPDFRLLAKIDCRGVIVTARGDECDFVSRFFTPRLASLRTR